MNRRPFSILRIVCYVMLAWFVISLFGRLHWLLLLLIITIALANVAVVWMLRANHPALANVCRRKLLRQYVGWVCFFTGEQLPLDTRPHANSSEVLLQTRRDFEIAGLQAKQIVRGHDDVVDQTLSKIFENQVLRKSRRQGDLNGPLASFLLVGPDGVGKRHLMRVLSKLLYGTGAVEVFDCDRLTVDFLTGMKDRQGEFLETVRKHPHRLILFENIEKASLDVSQLIVQLLTTGNLRQPGSKTPVSFQETTVALATSKASIALGTLAAEPVGDAARHQRAIELIGDETQIDRGLLSAVTDVCWFQPPSDLVKAEVVALAMQKECTAHNIDLSHVDPEIIATQVMQVDDSSGFQLVPQHAKKLLRKPLVALTPQQHESLSLRVRGQQTVTFTETR